MLASLLKLLDLLSVECNTTSERLLQLRFQRISLSFAYNHLLNAFYRCYFPFAKHIVVFVWFFFPLYAFLSNDVQH